jgi:hypothetical protein
MRALAVIAVVALLLPPLEVAAQHVKRALDHGTFTFRHPRAPTVLSHYGWVLYR